MSSSRNRNILSTIRRRKSPLALPLEILRRIVSHASDQATLAALCRLNEKTLQIAGPMLYKKVELRSANSFEMFFEPSTTSSPPSKRVAAALDVSQIQILLIDFDYHPSLERTPFLVKKIGTVPSRLIGLQGPLLLQRLVVVSDPKDPTVLDLLLQRVFVNLDPFQLHIHSSTLHESTTTLLVSEPPTGTFDRWTSLKSVTLRGLLPVVGPSLDASLPLVRLLRPEASASTIELVVDVRVLSGLDAAGTLASTRLLELAREESVERLKVVVGSDFERRIVSTEASKLELGARSKIGIRVQGLRREFPWELVELVMSFSSPSVLAAFCGASFKALQDAGKHLYGRVEIRTVPAFRAFFHHVSSLSPHSRIYPFLATSQIHSLHLNITSSHTLAAQGSPPTIQTPSRLASLPSALPLRHLQIPLRETDYADALKIYFARVLRHLNPVHFLLELTPNHARHPVLTDVGYPSPSCILDSWTSLEAIKLVGIFPQSMQRSPFSYRSQVLAMGGQRMKEIPKLKITLDMRTNSRVWAAGATTSVGGAWCRTMKDLPWKLVQSGMLDVAELSGEGVLILFEEAEEERLFKEGMQEVGLNGTARGEKIRVEVDPVD